MSSDEQSDDLRSLAGRVASIKRRSASERPQTDGPKILKSLKTAIFLLVALLAFSFGLRYRSYSNSGDISFIPPPQSVYFDAYVSNPRITISINLRVASASSNDSRSPAVLTLKARAPQAVRSATIILISTIPDDQHTAKLVLINNHDSANDTGFAHAVYVSQFSLPHSGAFLVSPPGVQAYGYKESYHLPGTVSSTKDRVFVQMPEIDEHSLSAPQLLSEKNRHTSQLIGFTDFAYPTVNPNKFRSGDPADLGTFYGVPGRFFWSPDITAKEDIYRLREDLRTVQVNSAVPTGTMQQHGYTWQSNGPMDPSLSTIDPNAVALESNWDFSAGIAFGIAVGAAVAFIQSLPDEIRRGRRWRKRLPNRS